MVRKKIDIAAKKKHLNFVYLSEEEYSELCARLGPDAAADWIEELDLYLGSKGAKYESHYYTILAWARRKMKRAAVTSPGKAAVLDRFIEDLKTCPSMPAMKPEAHAAAFAVLQKLKTPWPVLRKQLREDPAIEKKIRSAYLSP